MPTSFCAPPVPINEPVLSYLPGSHERAALRAALRDLQKPGHSIPMYIGGQRIGHADNALPLRMPHHHRMVWGDVHVGAHQEVQSAIDAAMQARGAWVDTSFEQRAAIFLRAAELLKHRYRATLNAATMLGQSKTVIQAELDAACELIDFWRFNVAFAGQLQMQQPLSSPGIWNRLDYRPLDGFVLAIAPFNFTAIAGNLATAPVLMGNTVVFKPAPSAALAADFVMRILHEAGLPPGVINLIQAAPDVLTDVALKSPHLAAVHFTGSTATFQHIWRTVAGNIGHYHCYPRLVGETGGKGFVVAHPSANQDALVAGLVRGAFEYQGQKCSAASRAYIPRSIWPVLSDKLRAAIDALTYGDVTDFSHFMGAVIDARAYDKIAFYLDIAKHSADAKIWLGGMHNNEHGYFIAPTVVCTTNPQHRLMREEIFGPVLVVYIYDDIDFDNVLQLCNQTSPYGLTGAIFAEDSHAIEQASHALRAAAGNFYINDKPTGAVVGQQPFGGSRASGTNDKAGSVINLMRFTSPRTIKENLSPNMAIDYPYMQPDVS